ncbi:NosR/NirI family protein [Vibrio japonicus]|uniref:NosR/NirI family protein n=1 Tax=Vibrio japonicus TaxID=1824638 RepID=A0ABY5LF37_9VIBR|nr:NosR/NirI family protein [Vibrio japonicus]UUM29550.1 NosR/NirI family protein [Vibrio japonicus]
MNSTNLPLTPTKLFNGYLSVVVKYFLLTLLLLTHTTHSMAQVTEIPQDIAQLFPSATRVDPQQESPPVIAVYQLNQLLGYVFQSDDITNFPGFSGDSINLLIGITPQGMINGIKVLNHHEPIFIHGMGEQPMLDFIDQYIGHSIKERFIIGGKKTPSSDVTQFDGITRATVSVLVIHDTIIASALKVARDKLEGFTPSTPFVVRPDYFAEMNFEQLVEQGFISRWTIDSSQLYQLPDEAQSEAEQYIQENKTFVDFYIVPLSIPIVGINLLGETEFARLNDNLKSGEHAIMMLNQGSYSFIGKDFIPQTVPSRIRAEQDQLPIELKDIDFYSFQSPYFAQSMPNYDDIQVFSIKAQSGFELNRTFNFHLDLPYAVNHLSRKSVTFSQPFSLPAQIFEKVEHNDSHQQQPLWMKIWSDKTLDISILVIYLGLIITIFVKQKTLTAKFKQFRTIRLGCLLITLFFVGFYLQGQLSVTNIYTLLLSLVNGFKIEFFLLDPVIFILWLLVFITLFIWGRGIFCGWLCPFGAMQELMGLVAEKLRIRQFRAIATYHPYLRNVKYFILVLLVFVAFYSLELAESLAEIEPFKTSITLHFIREIPFTVYAIALLLLSLKIHKVYCRYICPLGAGLAILGKFPLFKLITRKQECGNPCQLCRSKKCQIDAINIDGSINYQECIQCLECVVTIQNPDICVVSKYQKKGKRRGQISTKSI